MKLPLAATQLNLVQSLETGKLLAQLVYSLFIIVA